MKITLNQKILVSLIFLVLSMFYFISIKDDGTQRIISMLILAMLAYLCGRFHGQKIGSSNKVTLFKQPNVN
jgi:amino acid permease